jgi:hypothetical protein
MAIANIRRFNTQDTPDEAIIALQTGRDDIRQQVLTTIKSNLGNGKRQLQHLLIKGPRGFGKSYLTRLAEIDTHQLTTEGALVGFALLPEEQRNVSTPASLLREICRLVSGESWESVTSIWDDDEDAWGDAVAELDEALDLLRFGENQGLLVTAIENLDVLFSEVFSADTDQKALRKWMTRKITE